MKKLNRVEKWINDRSYGELLSIIFIVALSIIILLVVPSIICNLIGGGILLILIILSFIGTILC
jgi:hypothetical protein